MGNVFSFPLRQKVYVADNRNRYIGAEMGKAVDHVFSPLAVAEIA